MDAFWWDVLARIFRCFLSARDWNAPELEAVGIEHDLALDCTRVRVRFAGDLCCEERFDPRQTPQPPDRDLRPEELLAISRRVYTEIHEAQVYARQEDAYARARVVVSSVADATWYRLPQLDHRTATEIMAQQRVAAERRAAWDRLHEMMALIEPLDPFHVFHDNREAYDKGFRLFQDNLTAAQREQFERTAWFDVVGSDSGKTYRIHKGTSMNVAELDKAGYEVNRWCFRPEGNLVLGDILLAQKVMLEACEKEVLKIANPARRSGGAPIAGMQIIWMLAAGVVGSLVLPLLAPALAVLGIGPLAITTPMVGAVLGAFIAHNA